MVKAVDENDKPTEWEAKDLSSYGVSITDDGDGNVVLTTMAIQEPENIVTDDGDGNVEVHSTSLYNPFPGIDIAAVNQVAQIVEIDEKGLPAKWQTIDIAGWTENKIETVLEENMYEFDQYGQCMIPFTLMEDGLYTVTFNHKTYQNLVPFIIEEEGI